MNKIAIMALGVLAVSTSFADINNITGKINAIEANCITASTEAGYL